MTDASRPSWRRAVGALAVLITAGCTPADPLNLLAPRGSWDMTSLPYADGTRHTLDVYRPRAAKDARHSAPVIVFFYGGNWQGGQKDMYLFVAAALAARGYVTIVPDYQIYPPARFPAFLEDGAQAIGWAKRNAARFGGDPSKLFLMGHSAGAHIAAMLTLDGQWLREVGLQSRRDIAGLIGISGPYDFLPLRDPTLQTIFAGPDLNRTQPISFVTGGEPPALLVTGAADQTVKPGNTTRLAAKLRAAGGAATEIVYPRVGHTTIIGAFAPVLRFLAPVLSDVDSFVARAGTNAALRDREAALGKRAPDRPDQDTMDNRGRE
ncbi:MAG: alpha/beta hydrolase [Xanthobacteraceae bacterium]